MRKEESQKEEDGGERIRSQSCKYWARGGPIYKYECSEQRIESR
jgi:hypothetical protein